MEERDLDTVGVLAEQPMVVVSFPGRSEGLWSDINLLTADLRELETFDRQTIRTWMEYALARLNDAERDAQGARVARLGGPYQGRSYRRLPAVDDE